MKNFSWKPLIPHIIAIAVFLIVALIYCKPALEGKVLQQHDITQWKAMSKDIHDFEAKHSGDRPLWTNSMFSGMPGYMIAMKANNVVPYFIPEVLSLFLPKPFQFFFLACVCFYIFCLVLRTNPYVGIIGALAYAYATYNPIIVGAGHDTKMLVIALLPGFIAGLILIYERRYWIGAALTATFLAAMIAMNHMQITYYGLIIAFAMTIGYVVRWIMRKDFKHMMVAGVFAIVAGLIGVMSNAVTLFTTYEYSKETIRGGSQLADSETAVTKDGLSTSYALSYSVTKSEPLVLMFPRMFGGSSQKLEVSEENSKAIESLRSMPQELGQQVQPYLNFYWGGISSGTSGPPYAGAIVCLLALFGFVFLNNKHKWWILATIFLTVLMSWGEYFLSFNSFLLQHLPFYNKFRAPSMILVVPTFLLCMLAVMTLDKMIFRTTDQILFKKQFKQGLIVVASVFVIALLMYMSFDFVSKQDTEVLKQVKQADMQIQEPVKAFFNALKEDRRSLFLGDLLRSLLFCGVAVVFIWLYMRKTIKPIVVLLGIGLFAMIDVLAIDAKYLNDENYQEAEQYDESFSPSREDLQIMQDKSNYRVLDLRGGISSAFNAGAMTAYFHKTIGGYHPAKLSIYQDLIEKQLYKFPNCMPVINMLNTKYIINSDGKTAQVIPNPDAFGPVWLVKGIRWVNGPKEEIAALDNLNTKDSVVIDRTFQTIGSQSFTYDSTAKIEWQPNGNDHDLLTYHFNSNTPQFAVFSEVYYKEGWKAYVDGKEAPYVKANYVLRAMPVPAGEHKIEFRFEPQSHKIGSTITLICSVLMLALLGFGLWMFYKKREPIVEDI